MGHHYKTRRDLYSVLWAGHPPPMSLLEGFPFPHSPPCYLPFSSPSQKPLILTSHWFSCTFVLSPFVVSHIIAWPHSFIFVEIYSPNILCPGSMAWFSSDPVTSFFLSVVVLSTPLYTQGLWVHHLLQKWFQGFIRRGYTYILPQTAKLIFVHYLG